MACGVTCRVFAGNALWNAASAVSCSHCITKILARSSAPRFSSISTAVSAHHCLRPYHVENASSRPITEAKQRRAWLVLGWVTAWEYQVL
ncbi:hypothetical protein EB796_022723 [Bugula neritina]|uniref:Uncharacterized protein n=1 Tax=Bugula neritina TaxID=10212 RepID=A0A7J7IZW4_BUGNE|nr:hypothetical protein EB796_022723 [Bugula neritina]